MTCIHSTTGLCPDCQANHDEDPTAWMEYGNHPDGIARWKALQEEMAAEAAAEAITESGPTGIAYEDRTPEEQAQIPF